MRFHVFLPTDLAEKLIKLAEKEDRNPKQQAARLLKEAIERAIQHPHQCKEYACVSEE